MFLNCRFLLLGYNIQINQGGFGLCGDGQTEINPRIFKAKKN